MSIFKRSAVQGRRSLRLLCTACAGCLVLAAGCRTSDDAAAAATQMSTTAKTLSDYYTALGTILQDSDQIYRVNLAVFSKPYPPENQQLVKTAEDELAKRAKLAADFSDLAANFGKLTGSTAPGDVGTSAGKLETECESLAGVTSSSMEQNAIKGALQALVVAVQEHKEREAARAMDAATKGLADLFAKEAPTWNSVEHTYAETAATLAKSLVDKDAVDDAWVLKPALDPFGLATAPPSADMQKSLADLAKTQIETKKADLDKSYDSATDAMEKSLTEMARRVHLVAEDKPMSFKAAPPSLATVEQWAQKVISQ